MNTEHDWLVWWHDEGSGMRPVNGQDHEGHVRDMTRIAWLNGAFCAADEIERLRKERDEARLQARRILNEIDCRIEHGAESGGHLEAIRNLFTPNDIAAHKGGFGWGGGMETLCALALSPTQNHLDHHQKDINAGTAARDTR